MAHQALAPDQQTMTPADRAEALLDRIIKIKGGTRREGQVEMAREVASSLHEGRPALLQAGTGVGKSLAYLAGALGARKQTVVAPQTKALQDQLVNDLNLIASVFSEGEETEPLLPHQPKHAVIKGRSSYLCLAKTRVSEESGDEEAALVEDFAPTSGLGKEVKRLQDWGEQTDSGDRTHLPFTVSHGAWKQVSTTAEDCNGKACPFYQECFAEQARERAKTSDIIVVNQAFLATHMKIASPGSPARLLPETVGAVIVDEAHEFSGVVANVFGAEVTTKRLKNVVSTVMKPVKEDRRNCAEAANEAIDTLDKVVYPPKPPKQADLEILTEDRVREALEHVSQALDKISPLLMLLDDSTEEQESRKKQLRRTLANAIFDVNLLLTGTTDRQVAWVDSQRGQTTMHSAQFDVSDTVHQRLLQEFSGVVFTSATLTIGGSFDLIASNFGFDKGDWSGHVVQSPFDYNRQGLIWTPEDMPLPSTKPKESKKYFSAVADVAHRVSESADGRTLVLCTSRASVTAISEALESRLGGKRTLLVQGGDAQPKQLAKEFAEDPHSILVGTRTFWTGISVEGDTCAAVVIDKMPFPSPGDPIIAARSDKADRENGPWSGFRQVSLAEAILTMIQGSGRLIRTIHDRGVIVFCDPRVHVNGPLKKSYARDIMKSLPPFPVTSDEKQVMSFLREINATADDTRVSVEVKEEEPA